MEVNADKIKVTNKVNDKVYGYLFWYSVGHNMIKHDDLKELLIQSNLDVEWMPNKIRVVDAFRRATKEIEKTEKTKDANVIRKYLVREVTGKNKVTQRNIVTETINKDTKELMYDSTVGIIKLDKNYGHITFEAEENHVYNMCEEVEERFYLYRDHYSSQHLRILIPKILNSLAPTPMRKNGTIYFVPRKMEEGLDNLISFINSLEESEGYKVPIVETSDNEEMVIHKYNDYVDHLIEQCDHVDDLRKDQVKDLIEESYRVIDDYHNYEHVTSSESDLLSGKVKRLDSKAFNIIQD